jgi:hypothetical protein
MALIVHINRQVPAGAEIHAGLQQIRAGIGKLEELDGLRAQAIGASAAEMQAVFGTNDTAEAQALNDRWAAFLDAYSNSGNPAFDEYAILRDLVDALVANN